ncbi:4Fe-4S dicluster domain-containing protein [Acetohalobium arabaticum]|uniref:4Fe-4S ferredoxin iron-sulfur binding domain protein n=1 Tax=Acetohalobium arabaticum (strain ATCC 49924 / DSM 5501 / Z-7288) TaxID=574087 RepID=D9QSK5_ACEAZ|nr:4Fe-4S binding protein [Acetohalobium arabaticum]ADL13468.1 4Fe-4S ferredoxin iron-sulfur binding domain protein [Acetohalobium arabaticum DSM 5501]
MTVKIDKELCDECKECIRICPGNLLYQAQSGAIMIRNKKNCWDCGACVKKCPQEAIEMYLPVEIGGRGSSLKASQKENKLIWKLKKFDGSKKQFIIKNKT